MPPLNENRINEIIDERLATLIKSDRFTFEKLIQLLDGRNIQVGRANGTTIGTATDQKVGVYGSKVIQGTTISDPAGQANDLDSEARTAINALIDRLQDFGIIA